MKVGLDTKQATRTLRPFSGLPRVTTALARAYGRSPKCTLGMFSSEHVREKHEAIALSGSFDVIHWPYGLEFLSWPGPLPRRSVVTIHDMRPVLFPTLYRHESRWVSELGARLVSDASVTVHVLSNAVGGEVEAVWPALSGRVVVGTPNRFELDLPALDLSEAQVGYFLVLGTLASAKNLPMLLAAWRRANLHGVELFLVGPDGDGAEIARRIVSEFAIESVRFIGEVTEIQRLKYFAGAACFVQVSIHEGCGLAAIEARHLGLPTLLSDIPAHREFAATDAIFVNPLDIESIQQGLIRAQREWRRCAPGICANLESQSMVATLLDHIASSP